MAFIPQPFGTTSPEQIASYDFQDIASATGTNLYYGTCSSNAITASYALVSSAVYSLPIATAQAVSDNGGVKVKTFDQDFDILFNRSIVLKGDSCVNVPHTIRGGSSAHTMSAQIQCYIRKWDGTTETTLTQGSGAILIKPSTATTQEQMANILMKIPKTHFKRGEYLRLTVEGWYSVQTGGTPTTFDIGHDPKNQTATGFTNVDRILTFPVPQRIDI